MITPKAFIFDLDGVITDTAVYHYQAWKRLAEHVGVTFTEDDNEKLKGVGRRESLDYILKKGTAQYDEAAIESLMTQKNNDYIDLIKAITAQDILPNVEHVLADLRARGHKIGLASASKNAKTVITRLGIADQFDYVADAALIPNSKPAPDVFLDVMHHFGLTADECIGIEDAAAGVSAIKSANMFALGIGDASILAQADMVIDSMAAFDYDAVVECFKN